MKAMIYRRYGAPGAVVECADVEKPAADGDNVVIRVRAAALNPYDRHMVRGEPVLARLFTGLRKPKITRIGIDVAGIVESGGTRFKPGDEVFGRCRGALAEYACTPESKLIAKPPNVTFEQAAAVPVAGLTALQAVRDRGRVRPGQTVLINGAAGGVGTFAVQIAKSFGAEVTGVCSTRNVELVRALGADRVIDYTREDFTKNADRYDVVLDTVGNHSLLASRRVLTPTGLYAAIGLRDGSGTDLILRLLGILVVPRCRVVMVKNPDNDLPILGEMLETGRIKSVIDRIYPLAEAGEALDYLEQGHARGKVIVTP